MKKKFKYWTKKLNNKTTNLSLVSFNFILIFKNKHLVSSLYRAQQIFLFIFFFVMTGEKKSKENFFSTKVATSAEYNVKCTAGSESRKP